MASVNREAREEALKPYTKVFDTFFDLQRDTIFISDPIFIIREAMNAFMISEYANKLNHIAISSEIFGALAEGHESFPTLCDGPATILRMLEGLRTCTIAMSEDGAGDSAFLDMENILDESDEDGDDDEGDSLDQLLDGPLYDNEVDEGEENNGEIASEEEQRVLDAIEKEARESMSKGYFRNVGNINFEPALFNPNFWEEAAVILDDLRSRCEEESERHEGWVRPAIRVRSVEPGLPRLEDIDENDRDMYKEDDVNEEELNEGEGNDEDDSDIENTVDH